MKHKRVLTILSSTVLLCLVLLQSTPTLAGWTNDTVGDTTKTYMDITKLVISKSELTIILNENPYYNDTDVNWRFYNIWIDTDMQDTNPNTTVWSTDMYEYVAHFDCRWNGAQWINNSYLNAFRYYLTSDGSAEVEGSFYWDGNNWVGTDPDIDLAVITGKNITFNIYGAIHREQPLGTGYVIQGVASTSNGTIEDIAPNYGWLDEFDNMCELPEDNDDDPTVPTPFPNVEFLVVLIFFGYMIAIVRNIKKR